jgi:hypothetical protein
MPCCYGPAGFEDYRSIASTELQIGMSRHSGGVRVGGARLALVTALAVLAFAGGPLVAPVDAAVPNAAAIRFNPKVVLIVGPAEGATPYYRRLADEAAAAAARVTTNVVKVYSPDATWTNVKAALRGASLVVYLGHGNGWPSSYHTALFPTTEDGFGLNPNAGAADTHQYFGEQQIAAEIKLAPDAVVIFSHLCYASGNTEPGLAEGTLDQAQQRVDNYAAGFFQAGAGAVIADAYLAPAYYVRAVLRGTRTLDSIWRNAPNRNDHFLRFASQRTKGAVAQMDPDAVDSGFHRSIVFKPKLTSADVIANADREPGTPIPVLEPTLAGLGVTFGAPDLTTTPTAGSKTTLTLPVASDAAALLPAKLMLGTRWDRLDADAPADPTTGAGGPSPSPSPSSPAGGATGETGTPTVGGDDPGTTAPQDPAIDLVVPEQAGEIVAPVRATRLPTGGIAVPVAVPSTPGLYRLVATIHQPDGVAYDAATQALVPALVVRVTGPLAATYEAPLTATAAAGTAFTIKVRVTNLGLSAWGLPAEVDRVRGAATEPAMPATVVARWVDLDAVGAPASPAGSVGHSDLPVVFAPGASVDVDVPLTTPSAPGEYLLVLDVVVPVVGSLAAAGVPPGIVGVTVTGE